MLSNLTITVQNFVRKFGKLTELLIIEFLVVKYFQCGFRRKKKPKHDNCHYIGRIASEIQT